MIVLVVDIFFSKVGRQQLRFQRPNAIGGWPRMRFNGLSRRRIQRRRRRRHDPGQRCCCSFWIRIKTKREDEEYNENWAVARREDLPECCHVQIYNTGDEIMDDEDEDNRLFQFGTCRLAEAIGQQTVPRSSSLSTPVASSNVHSLTHCNSRNPCLPAIRQQSTPGCTGLPARAPKFRTVAIVSRVQDPHPTIFPNTGE